MNTKCCFQVDTGRWAYTKVMSDASSYSTITNPYGLLRSPWNTNPVPYLLRYDYTFTRKADGFLTFPTCSDFADYVGYDFSIISNAVRVLPFTPVPFKTRYLYTYLYTY